MSWKHQQCRDSAIEPVPKGFKTNDLDMAARRILEGLGISVKNFPRFEEAQFDTNYVDECLWSRVQRYFNVNATGAWTSLTFCEAKALPSKMDAEPPRLNRVWVYRDGPECYCELLCCAGNVTELEPPYLAMKWLVPGTLIVKMKAKDFAKQYAVNRQDASE